MTSPELLRRFPYFTAGGEEALKAIAMLAEVVRLAPGERLFREGDNAECLYVVTGGEVFIQLRLGSGHNVVVDFMVEGDLVGWSAVSEPYSYRASCVARKETELIAIEAKGLRNLIEEYPKLGRQLLREVVRALTHRLEGAWVQLAAAAAP